MGDLPERLEDAPPSDAMCDGGDLDCGSGLLLIIRDAMQPIPAGGVLEVRSRESSVRVDLPAWCRMVGHTVLGERPGQAKSTSYFLRKHGAKDLELETDFATARDFEWTVRVGTAADGMQARAYVRNHAFSVGQPASFDTEDAAPSAIEYLLASLASCLAVGMRWRATRRGIDVFHLEVSLRARADNILVFLGIETTGHPGLRSVVGRLFVDADADDEVLAELWNETLNGSPVAQTLARPIPLEIERRSH